MSATHLTDRGLAFAGVRVLLLLVAALLLGGCGTTGATDRTDADLTLLLGSPPTGVHAGIFLAVERGYDEAEGIKLTVRRSGDAGKLLHAGRVQAAILDAPAPGTVCVMAITQTPKPGHFVCVLRTTLEDHKAEVTALIRTLQRGYTEAIADPESAVQAMLTRAGGLDQQKIAEQLDAASPSFEAGVPAFGYLERGKLPPGDFAYGLVGPVSRD
jgi:ABC-type nitrate/sulfonate/bicarbonate transport system substrate-binding protein